MHLHGVSKVSSVCAYDPWKLAPGLLCPSTAVGTEPELPQVYLAPNLIPSHATHTAIPASSATQEERSFSWFSALSYELMPSMNSQKGQLSHPCSSCHPDFLSMCHTLTGVLR